MDVGLRNLYEVVLKKQVKKKCHRADQHFVTALLFNEEGAGKIKIVKSVPS